MKEFIESSYDKYYYDIVAAKRSSESYHLGQQQQQDQEQQLRVSPVNKVNNGNPPFIPENAMLKRQQLHHQQRQSPTHSQHQQQQDTICNYSLNKNNLSVDGELGELEMELVDTKCNTAQHQIQRIMTHFEMNEIVERLPSHLINVLSSNVARNRQSADELVDKFSPSRLPPEISVMGNDSTDDNANGNETGSENGHRISARIPANTPPHRRALDHEVNEIPINNSSNYELTAIEENASNDSNGVGCRLSHIHGPPPSKRRKHSH